MDFGEYLFSLIHVMPLDYGGLETYETQLGQEKWFIL